MELNAPRTPTIPNDAQLEKLVFFYRALGDGTRMKILWMLMAGELCVGDLARSVDMTESAISRQLRELRTAKLVRARRDKRIIYYSVNGTVAQTVLEETLDHLDEEARSERDEDGAPRRRTLGISSG